VCPNTHKAELRPDQAIPPTGTSSSTSTAL
jgi:hypothetical protein